MKTKKGIYTNISESDYLYNFNGLVYYFSSKFYLNKFKDNVRTFIENETIKFKNKYGVIINLDLYFSIVYYKKVEKRGFYIKDNILDTNLTDNLIFGNQIIKY